MDKKYNVKGMSCAACQAHVDKAIRNLDCVSDCNVNLLTNSAVVTFKNDVDDLAIKNALQAAGYDVVLEEDIKKKSKDFNLINLIISFSLLLILMYISMSHMFNLPLPPIFDNAIVFAVSQLVLTIPICIIYHHYFVSGYKKLFKLAPSMDSLVALSATASLVYGIFSIVMIIVNTNSGNLDVVNHYHHNLYFESAAMILTLVSFGKFLEERAKKKTLSAIEKMINLVPNNVLIKRNNESILIETKDLIVGDIAIFYQGNIISCDGYIVSGSGYVNDANLTGESMPKFLEKDNSVYSSSTLVSGYIEVYVTKEMKDTSINKIIDLVTEASNSKAPISKFADKVSFYFVPIVMAISLLSFIMFIIFSHDFSLAFNMFCSVLVVACPCALGLATPVAIMVGVGKGASLGLLIKNAEILEKASRVDTILLDKTGTLTYGVPKVEEALVFNDAAKDIAYSLELKSNHPLSNAIKDYLVGANTIEFTDFQNIDGEGILGCFEDETYYLGNKKMYNSKSVDKELLEKIEKYENDGYTVLILFKEDANLALFMIRDTLRENSKLAIKEFKRRHIRPVMLTGDNEVVASRIANELGISEYVASMMPSDKNDVLKKYKTNNSFVAMVGDGVNDSIALTNADLSIAIGNGSDIAIDSSDIVLQNNDILDIINVIDLSKRVFRTIKLNLFWAFFYNLFGIVFASGLLYPINHNLVLSPMICSLLMSFSSVFVVLNALTINLFKKIKIDQNEEKKEEMEEKITVLGMMCSHCAKRVEDAALASNGVKEAKVSLEDKTLLVKGENLDLIDIRSRINAAGYEAK